MGAHSTNSDSPGQPDSADRTGDLVVELAILTAPDSEVYRPDRRGRCSWVGCPDPTTVRFCHTHRAWRMARNRIKVRTALMVRIVAIELEHQGYPVVAS